MNTNSSCSIAIETPLAICINNPIQSNLLQSNLIQFIMAEATPTESPKRVHAVHVDGLAVLKIVKHCQESLPSLVAGTLLGLDVKGGVLEITHAFPNPEPPSSNDDATEQPSSNIGDGVDYSLEMLKMLREVNVDNNCVGFYQSISLGTFNTAKLVEEQFAYQAADVTDLQVAVLILFDPIQTTRGNLVLKCLRLTNEAIDMIQNGKNSFLDPKNIFEELPVTIKNPSLVKALLHNVKTGQYHAEEEDNANNDINSGSAGGDNVVAPAYKADTTFDRLDLSTNPYLEKHLEFMCTWVDDLAAEQSKFQYYMRALARGEKRFDKRSGTTVGTKEKVDAKEAWASSDAPRRLESLLISNQIRTYCDQVDKFADGGLGKLFVVDGLHRDESKA